MKGVIVSCFRELVVNRIQKEKSPCLLWPQPAVTRKFPSCLRKTVDDASVLELVDGDPQNTEYVF